MIQKVTTGFVTQEYDPETKKFKSQEFVAGDESTWTVDGEDHLDLDDAIEAFDPEDHPEMTLKHEGPEPYLNFDMLQPDQTAISNPDGLDMCEQLQEDLMTVLDGLPNEAIGMACQVVLNRLGPG